jgi:opacity protein-like surface antigen
MGDSVNKARDDGRLPGKRLIMLPPPAGPDGPGFSDNFDTYANGSGLVPQGGWLYWNGSGPPAALNATIDNTLSVSPPNSAVGAVESDNVQVFNITSGHWICKVQTYTPSTATGIGYFIMLNTYTNPYVSGGNWSIEVSFNRTTNLVQSVNRSVANGGPGNTTLPLITDQWVELVIDIDLDTDAFTMTYGGQGLVTTNGKWSFNASNAAGTPRIQCIDLYSQMAGFRWDDLSLQPVATPPSCYANCDSSTSVPFLNVNDFICFQQKYAAGDTYANCDNSTTAPVLNVNDFICFQTAFAAGCSAP